MKILILLSILLVITTSISFSQDSNTLDSLLKSSEKLRFNNLKESLILGEEYYNLAQKIGSLDDKITATIQYSHILEMNGNREESETLLKKTIRKNKDEKDQHSIVRLLLRLGRFYQVSNHEKSYSSFLEAKKILDQNYVDSLKAKLDCYFGVFFYHDLKDEARAEKYLLNAYRLYNEINDTFEILNSKLAIVDMSRASNNIDKYKKNLEEFKQLINKYNKEDWRAVYYRYLGMYYMAIEKFEKAIPELKKSVELNYVKFNLQQVADIYTMISYSYSRINELDKGLEFDLKALETRKQFGFEKFISSSLINVAYSYYYKQDYKNSIKYAYEGLEKAQKLMDKFLIKRAYKILYQSHQDKGEFKAALDYNIMFNKYSDSLLSFEVKKKVDFLESRHKIVLKNNKLEEQQRIEELEQRYTYVIYILSIFSFILLIFISKKAIQKLKKQS